MLQNIRIHSLWNELVVQFIFSATVCLEQCVSARHQWRAMKHCLREHTGLYTCILFYTIICIFVSQYESLFIDYCSEITYHTYIHTNIDLQAVQIRSFQISPWPRTTLSSKPWPLPLGSRGEISQQHDSLSHTHSILGQGYIHTHSCTHFAFQIRILHFCDVYIHTYIHTYIHMNSFQLRT